MNRPSKKLILIISLSINFLFIGALLGVFFLANNNEHRRPPMLFSKDITLLLRAMPREQKKSFSQQIRQGQKNRHVESRADELIALLKDEKLDEAQLSFIIKNSVEASAARQMQITEELSETIIDLPLAKRIEIAENMERIQSKRHK